MTIPPVPDLKGGSTKISDIKTYIKGLKACLDKTERELSGKIDAAAEIIADAASEGRLVHVFGTEAHTAALAGELFFRGVGFACINPLFDPAIDLSHGAYRSELCRNMAGLAPCIMDYYENIEPGDPIILISGDPEGVFFMEAVNRAVEKGLRIIAIVPCGGPDGGVETGVGGEAGVGGDLCDEAGVGGALDKADVVLEFHAAEGFGGANTVCMATILNCIAIRALEKAGVAVDIWRGGRYVKPEDNRELIEKYINRVKHL